MTEGQITILNQILIMSMHIASRGVTIHPPQDMICIVILTSQYDTYRDTFFHKNRDIFMGQIVYYQGSH